MVSLRLIAFTLVGSFEYFVCFGEQFRFGFVVQGQVIMASEPRSRFWTQAVKMSIHHQ